VFWIGKKEREAPTLAQIGQQWGAFQKWRENPGRASNGNRPRSPERSEYAEYEE
jgi:hypothetical protein